jgi:hypothetical protein
MRADNFHCLAKHTLLMVTLATLVMPLTKHGTNALKSSGIPLQLCHSARHSTGRVQEKDANEGGEMPAVQV